MLRKINGTFKSRPLAERFQEGYEISETGCWEWKKARRSAGVGAIRESVTRRNLDAYRVAYELYVGPIPPGLFVCHTCDNRSCVNPAHLFLGTAADNAHDRDAKGRGPRGERQGSHKLNASQVLEILQTDTPAPALAAKFGVTRGNIYHVRKRRNWRHIEASSDG